MRFVQPRGHIVSPGAHVFAGQLDADADHPDEHRAPVGCANVLAMHVPLAAHQPQLLPDVHWSHAVSEPQPGPPDESFEQMVSKNGEPFPIA
jgi:hypothetical protein